MNQINYLKISQGSWLKTFSWHCKEQMIWHEQLHDDTNLRLKIRKNSELKKTCDASRPQMAGVSPLSNVSSVHYYILLSGCCFEGWKVICHQQSMFQTCAPGKGQGVVCEEVNFTGYLLNVSDGVDQSSLSDQKSFSCSLKQKLKEEFKHNLDLLYSFPHYVIGRFWIFLSGSRTFSAEWNTHRCAETISSSRGDYFLHYGFTL